jgi:hypothetical protein
MCKALTGLKVEEFKNLVPEFALNLDIEKRESKKDRLRKYGCGRIGRFKNAEEKLFVALMYLKTYPTFDVLSFIIELDRSNCCRDVHLFLKALERTLKRKFVLPERKINSVEEFLQKFPEVKDIFIDGTERPVQKPVNNKRRNKLYSGKKKATTRKNIVVSDIDKRVLVLTQTKSGRRHDKRLTDKANLPRNIPDNVKAWVDTGFIGMEKDHPNTVIPKKASKNHPLTAEEKYDNKLISGIRVLSEHAICGIKRMRVAKDIYRNRIKNLDDKFMMLSTGIWNYHLSFG